MKVFAIVLLCVFACILDLILGFLMMLGIPFVIANLIPVIIIGFIFEICSDGAITRGFFSRIFRILIIGAVMSFIILALIPWILKPILVLLIGAIVLAT